MTAAIARPRIAALAAASALALTATLAAAPAAHADVADVWTTYPNITACKADLLNLNNICYGLQNGQAIGLVDVAMAVDELDQSLGIDYNDENTLPAPESATNPVVEVWNNTPDYTFLAPGTSLYTDGEDGQTIYDIPPGQDLTGPAVDADGAQSHYKVTIVGHSLGAALSLIDPVYLPVALPNPTPFYPPRVGPARPDRPPCRVTVSSRSQESLRLCCLPRNRDLSRDHWLSGGLCRIGRCGGCREERWVCKDRGASGWWPQSGFGPSPWRGWRRHPRTRTPPSRSSATARRCRER
jgi:hypothetical protein